MSKSLGLNSLFQKLHSSFQQHLSFRGQRSLRSNLQVPSPVADCDVFIREPCPRPHQCISAAASGSEAARSATAEAAHCPRSRDDESGVSKADTDLARRPVCESQLKR